MASGKRFEAWINPLAFLEVDEPWASAIQPTITFEDVVQFVCQPNSDPNLESLIARYREISQEPVRLFAAPAEPRILQKLIWPLRNAKASYMLGNYLAVIALCGMVGEMVAILCWELGEPTLRGSPADSRPREGGVRLYVRTPRPKSAGSGTLSLRDYRRNLQRSVRQIEGSTK